MDNKIDIDKKEIATKVAKEIAKYHIEGLGKSSIAWSLTVIHHEEFIEQLDKTWANNTEENRRVLNEKAKAYIQSWKEASAMYRYRQR